MKKIVFVILVAVGMLAGPQVASAALLAPSNPWSNCSGGYVNISFDDSPTQNTSGLLSTLKNQGIKATFFDVGNRSIQYPQAVKDQVAGGHQVENHSWIHQDMSQPTDIQAAIDLAKQQGLIAYVSGSEPVFFRPPYGIQPNPQVLAEVGLTEVVWTVDTEDWANPPVQTIVDRALTVKAGGFILMHDGYTNTLQAIPKIATGLKAKHMCPGKIVKSNTATVAWEGRSFFATVAPW